MKLESDLINLYLVRLIKKLLDKHVLISAKVM